MANHVHLVGRLVYQPELKTSANEMDYLSIRLACKRSGSKEASFVDVKFFDGPARLIAKWKNKGDIIQVDGYVEINYYNNQAKLHVVGTSVEFLTSSRKEELEEVELEDAISKEKEPSPEDYQEIIKESVEEYSM